MKKKTLLVTVLYIVLCYPAIAQISNKPITKDYLEYFLKRSIDIQGMSALCYPGINDGGPHYNGRQVVFPGRYTNTPPSQEDLNVTNGYYFQIYQDLLRLIRNVRPKFVGTAVTYWGDGLDIEWGADGQDWNRYINRGRSTVEDIKAIDPEIIVQGAPNEYIDQHMIDVIGDIPEWVFAAIDPNYTPGSYTPRPFDISLIDPMHVSGPGTPDITQLETKMWFYFLGVTYIDMGCESLTFSNMGAMSGEWGNEPTHFNVVFDKLRQYADGRSDIRFLLLTGHTIDMRDTYGNLPLDFFTNPIRPSEDLNFPLNINGGTCLLKKASCAPYGESVGGLTPSGWVCAHLPIQVFIDNYGFPGGDPSKNNPPVPGGTPHSPAADCHDPFAWDEITWFALRDYNYRNNWLAYAHHKVQCLDKNAYLSFPVKRGLAVGETIQAQYLANDPIPNLIPEPPTINNVPGGDINRYALQEFHGYGQENTIKDIIFDVDLGGSSWTYHNFHDEDRVWYTYSSYPIQKDMIFAGPDKMFYASTTGEINGFAWEDNGWVPISPTFDANVPWSSQVKYKDGLVASPDGSLLLYIGVDDYIHAFSIVSNTSYIYWDFHANLMQAEGLTAVRDLIFPTNDRVYYIAKESNNNTTVQALIHAGNNVWHSISPPHSADLYNNQPYSTQMQAEKGLAYDVDRNRIYYIGIDHYIYYYEDPNNNGWFYTYNDAAKSELINQNLLAAGDKLAVSDNKVYYSALESSGDRHIHAVVDHGTQWGTVSPSHSAHIFNGQLLSTQVPAAVNGQVAVSPDGSLIAYDGIDGKPYYYKDINGGWDFFYNTLRGIPGNVNVASSLQFKDDNTLFYNSVSPLSPDAIHYHQFEYCHCLRNAINVIEPGYYYKQTPSDSIGANDVNTFSAMSLPHIGNNITDISHTSNSTIYNNNNNDTKRSIQNIEPAIRVYPIPAGNKLNIQFDGYDNVNNYEFAISNVVGISVLKDNINHLKSEINISSLAPGAYFISIYDSQQRLLKNEKLIVQ